MNSTFLLDKSTDCGSPDFTQRACQIAQKYFHIQIKYYFGLENGHLAQD